MPGGQDLCGEQCPVSPSPHLSTGISASSPNTDPTLTTVDAVGLRAGDLRCSRSSQTWGTKVSRKSHWGRGSAPDPLLDQVAPHTSATEGRTCSLAEQLLLSPLHIKCVG